MRRIATGSNRNPAIDLFGTGKHGFKTGNRSLGDPPSTPGGEWYNAVQETLAQAIEQGMGVALDPNDHLQLLKLIKHIAWAGNSAAPYQVKDETLTALAGLTTSADKLIYATGADQFALTPLTAFIRTLLDDADAATARATLGAAPLDSPALTGIPTAPTAATGTNTTQVATTAFVNAEIAADRPFEATLANIKMDGAQSVGSLNTVARGDHVHPTDTSRAPLASPALTGIPTAPTASTGTRSTQLATTAFVGAESQIAAPTGSVYTFAGSTVPTGWLKCNGALLSRTTYASLFAVIGTTYGAGDGSTTFALPDLRGEFVRGADDGRGVDAGRTLGSAQAATRVFRDWWSDNGVGKDALGWNGSAVVCDYDGSIERVIDAFGPTWNGTKYPDTWIRVDGVRARPRNVAMHYIIKY